jgi:hypothetical protein
MSRYAPADLLPPPASRGVEPRASSLPAPAPPRAPWRGGTLPAPPSSSFGSQPRWPTTPWIRGCKGGVGQGQEGQPASGSSPSLAPSPSRVSASCSREWRGLACFGLGLLAAAVVVLASSLHRTPVTILSFLLQSSTSPLRLSPSWTTGASSASPRRRSMLPLGAWGRHPARRPSSPPVSPWDVAH